MNFSDGNRDRNSLEKQNISNQQTLPKEVQVTFATTACSLFSCKLYFSANLSNTGVILWQWPHLHKTQNVHSKTGSQVHSVEYIKHLT